MMLYKFMVILVMMTLSKCDISRPSTKVLSRFEIAEITRIAEENLVHEMENAMADEEKPPIFVEQPPPDARAYAEIETIRKNISRNRDVECNITAGYIWELCRPVLLKTCKEQYRTRCRSRTSPRSFRSFNRRLQRIFPIFRPPEIFKPIPLGEWFENQISHLNDAIKNSSNIQFTVSITNNNKTHTFTHEDVAEEIENVTDQFQRSMNRVFGKYRNLLRIPDLPARRYHNRFRERENEDFGEWLQRFLSRITNDYDDEDDDYEDDDDEDVEDDEVIERIRFSGAETRSEKSRPFDPSVILPKRLPKKSRNFSRRKNTRHRRSPHRGYYGRERTSFNPHIQYVRAPQRTGHRGNYQSNFMRQQRMQSREPWRNFAMPHPRIESHLPPRFPPIFPKIPHHGTEWPRWHHPIMRKPEFPRKEDIEISCEKFEESPEVCLEIAERTKKCESVLQNVCPKYMEARRRISERLDEVISQQHQITHVVRGDDDDAEEVNENYRWETQISGKSSIVIESIRINQRGTHDAYVIAKLSDNTKVEMVVPGSDHDISAKSLGKAIGKMAFDSYKRRGIQRHKRQ
ncbi:uncharacterized protein LOC120332564 [Styela clava]